MAGNKYFSDTPHKVISDNIVYADDLNAPLEDLAVGIDALTTDIQNDGIKTATDTGTVNTYAVSLDPAPTSLTAGLSIWLTPSVTNTGAATINPNSLGATEIRRHGMEVLTAGDLLANYPVQLKYNGTYFLIVSATGMGTYIAASKEVTGVDPVVVASAGASEIEISIPIPALSTGEVGDLPVINSGKTAFEFKPQRVLSPGAAIVIGNIHGLEYSRTGDNEITVAPGNCMDSLNGTELILSTATALAIPTTVDTVQNIFLGDDGLYCDTDVDGSGVSADYFRWLGFGLVNSSGILCMFIMADNRMTFGISSEMTIATLAQTFTVIDSADLSAIMPVSRISGIEHGIYRDSSTSALVTTSQDGTNVEYHLGKADNSNNGDTEVAAWGATDKRAAGMMPFSADRYYKSDQSSTELRLHAVTLRR